MASNTRNSGNGGNSGNRARGGAPGGKSPGPRGSARRGREKPGAAYAIGAWLSRLRAGAARLAGKAGGAVRAAYSKFRASVMARRLALCFLAVAFLSFFSVLAFRALTKKNAGEILLNGDCIGIVALKDEALSPERVTGDVIAKLEKDNGTKIQFAEAVVIETAQTRAKKEDFVPYDSVIADICASVSVKVLAAEISVDGVKMCVLKSAEEALEVKRNIIAKYIQEGHEIIDSGIVEDFVISDAYVYESEIEDSPKAYEKLTRPVETDAKYVVKEGDTLGAIAEENGITLGELQSLNPGLDPKKLGIGHELTLKKSKPFLSVRTVEIETYTDERVPYETITQTNPLKAASFQDTLQYGTYGVSRITTEITRINGAEVSQREVSAEVITEPVPEIIEVGTR